MITATIFIVEDHALTRSSIRQILETAGHEVIGVAGNAVQALGMIAKIQPKVVLVDIGLSGNHDGTWLVRKIKDRYPDTITFFLSGKQDLLGSEIENLSIADGFIPKPFSKIGLLTNVQSRLKAKQAESDSSERIISFPDGESYSDFDCKKILYLKSDGNYVQVVSSDRTKLLRTTLSVIKENCPSNFIRIHQRYVVNMDKVDRWSSKYCLIMETEISISRKYRAEVQSVIGER